MQRMRPELEPALSKRLHPYTETGTFASLCTGKPGIIFLACLSMCTGSYMPLHFITKLHLSGF